MQNNANNPAARKAYILTGPTSGIGLATAFEVAKHGTVVLVGRDGAKLSKVQNAIQQKSVCLRHWHLLARLRGYASTQSNRA